MRQKVLLVGGVFSSLLYVMSIDVIAALRYPDYHNYADQMVSELLAVGAPTRAGFLARPMPQPTPWLGLAERVNIYATMLWMAVLAISFLRVQDRASTKPIATTAAGSRRVSLSRRP